MSETQPTLHNLPETERIVHGTLNQLADPSIGPDMVQRYETFGEDTVGISSGGFEYPDGKHSTLVTGRYEHGTGNSTHDVLTTDVMHSEPKGALARLKGEKPQTTVETTAEHVVRTSGPQMKEIERTASTTTSLDKDGRVTSREAKAAGRKVSTDASKGNGQQTYEVTFTGSPEQQAAKRERYGELVTKLALKSVDKAKIDIGSKRVERSPYAELPQ